jgi:cobalt-zinc-cadmium efflux system protein
LTDIDCVSRIHDLHVWPLSTTEVALTVHVVVNYDSLDNNFLSKLQQHLYEHFNIDHATIQVESCEGDNECMLGRERCE